MKPNPCRTPSLDELGTMLEMGIQDLDLPCLQRRHESHRLHRRRVMIKRILDHFKYKTDSELEALPISGTPPG